jgi:hypothetical protein
MISSYDLHSIRDEPSPDSLQVARDPLISRLLRGKRLMQLARIVRTFGLLLVLGLAGSGSGCGPGSASPHSQEQSNRIKESKKTAHRQLKEDIQKGQGAAAPRGAMRKGARRGVSGP